ncbi:unnamed protein product, partial [Protopolystoma xenopodis]
MLQEPSLSDYASDWLNKFIQADNCFRDLPALLDLQNSDSVTVSGLNDLDYPESPAYCGGLLEIIKTSALPVELMEKFSCMRKNCLMGVFPDIQRAWVTVDNELFLWDYDSGEDLAFYDGMSDTIIAANIS